MGSGILRDFGPGLQPTLRDLATMMVIVSDNSATNLLLDRVGGPQQVNATMRDLGLPSIVVHRRIVFGEITTNDSLAEAAPRDLMRLVAMLAREELVSPEASREMLAILAGSAISSRRHASSPIGPTRAISGCRSRSGSSTRPG